LESLLLRISSELPSADRFVAIGSAVLLVLGGAAFALDRTAVGPPLRRALDRGLEWLIALLLLGMVFLSALQILLRNVFETGILWIDPLLRHLVLAVAFAGAILATGAKRHVQINVLGRLLKGRGARIGGGAVALLAGILCTWLTHASLLLLSEELAFGETVFLGVPSWAIVLVFPVALAVMALQSFHLVFRELAGQAPRDRIEGPLETGSPDAIAGGQDDGGEVTT
jgi:TRAP-type C4-dicarboxylate transport system permease small subunit